MHITQLVVVGDLNLHLEDPELPAAMEFELIAELFGLMQQASELAHRSDVFITRGDYCQLDDLAVHPPTVVYYDLVIATIPFF